MRGEEKEKAGEKHQVISTGKEEDKKERVPRKPPKIEKKPETKESPTYEAKIESKSYSKIERKKEEVSPPPLVYVERRTFTPQPTGEKTFTSLQSEETENALPEEIPSIRTRKYSPKLKKGKKKAKIEEKEGEIELGEIPSVSIERFKSVEKERPEREEVKEEIVSEKKGISEYAGGELERSSS